MGWIYDKHAAMRSKSTLPPTAAAAATRPLRRLPRRRLRMFSPGSIQQLLWLVALVFAAVLAALLLGAAGIALICWTLLRWGDADTNTDWGQVGGRTCCVAIASSACLLT